MRLSIHLKDEQIVVHQPDLENISRYFNKIDTTVTALFKLNQENDGARVYKYSEILEHFVFIQNDCKWQPRKIGFKKTIGKMYPVSISDTERYFLRLLLLYVPGATSFEFLTTVNGI